MKKITISILLLLAIGMSVSGVHAESYKIYEQQMPQHWQKDFGDALTKATQYWQTKTPDMTFEWVERAEQSDFVVEWSSNHDADKMSYYSADTENQYGKPRVVITLGFFKDGEWNLVSPEYVNEVTKHELGRAIGVPLSTDPSDIMYPAIENYESWQKSKTSDQPSTDWKEKSTKHQERSAQKLDLLKPEILKAETSLNDSIATNPESQVELDKAWNTFSAAKKYINDAELIQQEADVLFYASSYQDSYYKYKSSLDNANMVDANLLQIEIYLNNVSTLQ